MLLHYRKVCTEALNPVLEITEFADGAEHFTPPGEFSGSKSAGVGLVIFRHN